MVYYLALGAMPLAKTYNAPLTTTGTPLFPVAMAATWLQKIAECT
jgi:hypothetical protein